jgi:hypothetical protein
MKPVFISLVAGLACAATASSALARPSRLVYDAALRVGPGLSYPAIGTIPAGTQINLVRQDKVWSIVSYDGETGYLLTNSVTGRLGFRPDPPFAGNPLIRELDPNFAGPYAYYFGGRFGFLGERLGPIGGYRTGWRAR